MKRDLLLLMLFVVPSGQLAAATVNAASCGQTDVQAAIDKAKDGDTVLLPAGTAKWSAQVTVPGKAITIRGAGVGKTIIKNIQGDDSPITQDFIRLTMLVTAPSTGRVRITAVEFDGNRTACGITFVGGTWNQFQIDHCLIRNMRGRAIYTFAILSGLIYANEFVDDFSVMGIYGGFGATENESWRLGTTLGTTKTVVVEDNTIRYEKWCPQRFTCTCSHGHGGRAAWRHNTWINKMPLSFFPIVDAHGNQAPVINNSGPHRGTVQLEYYDNIFTSDADGATIRLCHLRGGTIVYFNNHYSGKSHFEDKFYLQEEDGPSRFNRLSGYPGEDQHWVYFWNNTLNDAPIKSHYFTQPADGKFIIAGTNLFYSPKPGYVPLAYPHPWRSENVR